MLQLTKQQQLFLCAVMLLLLTGWAVKAWRAAHPPAPEIATTGTNASAVAAVP